MNKKGIIGVTFLCLASALGYNTFLSENDKKEVSNLNYTVASTEAFYKPVVVQTNCMQRHCCPSRHSFITNNYQFSNYINTTTVYTHSTPLNLQYTPLVFNAPNFGSYNTIGNTFIIGGGIVNGGGVGGGSCCIPPEKPTIVPEPSTWLIMLLGFGIVGLKIRKPKNKGVLINEHNLKYRQL